mgnify:CR=1 FL=1
MLGVRSRLACCCLLSWEGWVGGATKPWCNWHPGVCSAHTAYANHHGLQLQPLAVLLHWPLTTPSLHTGTDTLHYGNRIFFPTSLWET